MMWCPNGNQQQVMRLDTRKRVDLTHKAWFNQYIGDVHGLTQQRACADQTVWNVSTERDSHFTVQKTAGNMLCDQLSLCL